MGSSALTLMLDQQEAKEVECEFHSICKTYQMARISEQHPLTQEDAVTQISEICNTPARFAESCYQGFKERK